LRLIWVWHYLLSRLLRQWSDQEDHLGRTEGQRVR